MPCCLVAPEIQTRCDGHAGALEQIERQRLTVIGEARTIRI